MATVLNEHYKIVLLGEVGVGKSTFFRRIRDGEFVTITGFTTSGECTSSVSIAEGPLKARLYTAVCGLSIAIYRCCYHQHVLCIYSWSVIVE